MHLRFNDRHCFPHTNIRALILSGLALSAVVDPRSARCSRATTQIYEGAHLLSVGAGISTPSLYSALLENPAGLVFNREYRVAAAVTSPNSTLNPIRGQIAGFTGNGQLGGGVSLENYNSQNPGEIVNLHYGMAAIIDQFNFSVGVSGTYCFQNVDNAFGEGVSSINNFNLGFLFDPYGFMRIGIVGYQLVGGAQAIGGGFSYLANPFATLTLDAASNTKFEGATLKPGVALETHDVQLSVGYGIRLDERAPSWLRKGVSIGLGLTFDNALYAQVYYNQFNLYSFSLAYKF